MVEDPRILVDLLAKFTELTILYPASKVRSRSLSYAPWFEIALRSLLRQQQLYELR